LNPPLEKIGVQPEPEALHPVEVERSEPPHHWMMQQSPAFAEPNPLGKLVAKLRPALTVPFVGVPSIDGPANAFRGVISRHPTSSAMAIRLRATYLPG
jgi:hypothetical protein